MIGFSQTLHHCWCSVEHPWHSLSLGNCVDAIWLKWLLQTFHVRHHTLPPSARPDLFWCVLTKKRMTTKPKKTELWSQFYLVKRKLKNVCLLGSMLFQQACWSGQKRTGTCTGIWPSQWLRSGHPGVMAESIRPSLMTFLVLAFLAKYQHSCSW